MKLMYSLTSLVDHLKNTGVLRTKIIIEAFQTIDRKDFVPANLQTYSYEDNALPIGFGQTISQPYTVAFMLELLGVKRGDRVLDVGSGSGYTTALLVEIADPKGYVCGVEIIPELVALGQKNLAKYSVKQADIRLSGATLGLPTEAPFDRILVSASAGELPKALIDQLKTDGIMVASIHNEIWKIEKKTHGKLIIAKHSGFAFVPLVKNDMSGF